MATAEAIVLSSSPSRYPKLDVAAMSSSPGLPSPSALLRPRSQLRTGDQAVPIPTNATACLTSAAILLRKDVHEIGAHTTPNGLTIETSATKTTSTMLARKPRASKEVDEQGQPSLKKPRKPKAKKADVEPRDEAGPKKMATRKPRAKKDAAEGQAKIPRGRVTKASSGSRLEKQTRKKKSDVTSNHFATADIPKDPFAFHEESSNDLLLQEAVKRRMDWTPPREMEDLSILAAASKNSNHKATDLDLFGSFGYNGGDKGTSARFNESVGPKKRKLIELIKTNISALTTLDERPKSTKKKTRTITELAISAYSVDADTKADKDNQAPPLLQYFSYEPSDGGEVAMAEGSKVLSRPRSKSPVKKLTKSSKSKKGTVEAPILLSPQTALKRVDRQEFVFGTSSQLAREESPTLLRDLQQAMQKSNRVENESFVDGVDHSPSSASSTTGRGTEPYKARRNLWAVASHGEMADVVTVDLSGSPEASHPKTILSSLPGQPSLVSSVGPTLKDDKWHRLDEDDPPVKKVVVATTPSNVGPEETAIRDDLRSSVTAADNTGPPTIKDMPSIQLISNSIKLREEASDLHKPDFGSYPTTRLAKEIDSYRFKPIKSRDQMIALLERCWEGRQRTALGDLGTKGPLTSLSEKETPAERSASSNDAIVPLKPSRGRPPKDSIRPSSPAKPRAVAKYPKRLNGDTNETSGSGIPLVLRQTPKNKPRKPPPMEDIYDSDPSPTPSPPRRPAPQLRKPPLPLQLSPSSDPLDSPALSLASEELHLHQHISRAITSAPPSQDPRNPSWHEKILLYDPIVLEDLTAWLNTGQLQRVGWDGEVDAKEVKAWCLRKSICCLWRENLRGGARSRY